MNDRKQWMIKIAAAAAAAVAAAATSMYTYMSGHRRSLAVSTHLCQTRSALT